MLGGTTGRRTNVRFKRGAISIPLPGEMWSKSDDPSMNLPSEPLQVIAPASWFVDANDRPKLKMSFSDGTLHIDKDDKTVALLIESNGVDVVGIYDGIDLRPLMSGWDLSDDFWRAQWNAEVDGSVEERS